MQERNPDRRPPTMPSRAPQRQRETGPPVTGSCSWRRSARLAVVRAWAEEGFSDGYHRNALAVIKDVDHCRPMASAYQVSRIAGGRWQLTLAPADRDRRGWRADRPPETRTSLSTRCRHARPWPADRSRTRCLRRLVVAAANAERRRVNGPSTVTMRRPAWRLAGLARLRNPTAVTRRRCISC